MALRVRSAISLAEGEGVEPPWVFPRIDFESSPFGHSGIPPRGMLLYYKSRFLANLQLGIRVRFRAREHEWTG